MQCNLGYVIGHEFIYSCYYFERATIANQDLHTDLVRNIHILIGRRSQL